MVRAKNFIVLLILLLGPQLALAVDSAQETLEAEAATLQMEISHLQNAGKYPEAITKAQRLVQVCRQLFGEEHPTVNNVTAILADLYEQSGQNQEARQVRSQLTSSQEISTPNLPEVDQLIISALSFFDRNDLDSAFKTISRAKLLLKASHLEQGLQYSIVMNESGRIVESLGQLSKAEWYYRISAKIAQQNGISGNTQQAVALNNLGALFIYSERYLEAKNALEESLAIDQKEDGRMDPESAVTIHNLGLINSRLGQKEKAKEYFLQAINNTINAYGEQHPNLIEFYDTLANEAWIAKDIQEMLKWQQLLYDVLAKSIADTIALGSERQKHLYLTKFRDMSNAAISRSINLTNINSQAGNAALEFILLRKSLVMDVLSHSFAQIHSNLTADEKALFQEYVQLLQAKAEWYSDDRSQKKNTPEIVSISRENELQEYFGSRSPVLGEILQKISVEDISKALPGRAALLEFVMYVPWQPDTQTDRLIHNEPRYAVYGIKSTGELQWLDLGKKKVLDTLIRDLQRGLSERALYTDRLGRTVFDKVMAPMEEFLQDVELLYIAPDDTLNLIPFGALIDHSGRYLVQRYKAINYLSSGRDLLKEEMSTKAGKAIIVADPDYGMSRDGKELPCTNSDRRSSVDAAKGFQRLCGTRDEAEALSNVLPRVESITGRQATESRIKQLDSPAILHLATHGYFMADNLRNDNNDAGENRLTPIEENLARSGLVFAGVNQRHSGNDDGILTALEAMGLKLTGTHLVVLSACESGLGETMAGEGVFGLRRALVIAGAETQVLSLWKVSDNETSSIMARFYALLVDGEQRCIALNQAQREYLENHTGQHAHPYYWAAFIVSGDCRPLSF